MNVNASQIRQDLNCFGGFGQQGYGYNVEYLYNKMVDILCLNQGYRAIILGAGNLGSALVHSPMFPKVGVLPVAMFDVRKEVIGTKIAGIPVLSIEKLEDFCKASHVDIAILTLSRAAAPEIAKRIRECGIEAIWNFTNAKLGLDESETIVESVHMSDSLMTLTYRLGFHNKAKSEKEKSTDN
jgi:redox-sensing transcriptional repressor